MIFKATVSNKAHPEFGQAMVTLYTCVNDQPAYRWYVTAREV